MVAIIWHITKSSKLRIAASRTSILDILEDQFAVVLIQIDMAWLDASHAYAQLIKLLQALKKKQDYLLPVLLHHFPIRDDATKW